jgi:hypothetical protein
MVAALPLGPTGYGNSPYQPLSSFAGGALIISPESLNAQGLLDLKDYDLQFAPGAIDYASVIPFKERLLEAAWNRFRRVRHGDLLRQYEEFCSVLPSWLEDYALFRALKARYGSAYYMEWPPELVERRPSGLAEARRGLKDEIDRVKFEQFRPIPATFGPTLSSFFWTSGRRGILALREFEKMNRHFGLGRDAFHHPSGFYNNGYLPAAVSPESITASVCRSKAAFCGTGRLPLLETKIRSIVLTVILP